MSNPEHISSVNLIGTARIIEGFEKYLSAGTVGILVASMAGYNETGTDKAAEHKLMTLKADELIPFSASLAIQDSGFAYMVPKRGNHLQVQAALVSWGSKRARIFSSSPGIISTPELRLSLNH